MKKLSGLALILASCVVLSACEGGTSGGSADYISNMVHQPNIDEIMSSMYEMASSAESTVSQISGNNASVCPAKPEIPDVEALPVSKLEYEFITNGPNGSGMQIKAINSATEDVRFPDTIDGEPVLYISDDLEYSKSVKTLIFPDSVTYCGTIPQSVEFVKLPESFDYEHSYFPPFAGYTELKEIWIPDGITEMQNKSGEGLFEGCTSLRSVSLPAGLTEIGKNMFNGCTSLESVYIPDSVETIGESAFAECSSLVGIIIPDSVTEMGKAWDGFSNPNSFKGYGRTFMNCTSLVSVYIGDGVTDIGNEAFSGCTSLSEVKLGKNIKNIGYSAFSQCTSLANIDLPDGLTAIGNWAFCYCSSLTKIVMPNTVVYAGVTSFDDCPSLESVTLSDSIDNKHKMPSFIHTYNIKTMYYKGKKYTSTADKTAFDVFWDDNIQLW